MKTFYKLVALIAFTFFCTGDGFAQVGNSLGLGFHFGKRLNKNGLPVINEELIWAESGLDLTGRYFFSPLFGIEGNLGYFSSVLAIDVTGDVQIFPSGNVAPYTIEEISLNRNFWQFSPVCIFRPIGKATFFPEILLGTRVLTSFNQYDRMIHPSGLGEKEFSPYPGQDYPIRRFFWEHTIGAGGGLALGEFWDVLLRGEWSIDAYELYAYGDFNFNHQFKLRVNLMRNF